MTSDESQTMTVRTKAELTSAKLMRKQIEERKREERLADEPLGPDRPTGEDYVAWFEAAELEVGDRFVWGFDGMESEIVAVFEARQDGIFGDEGDTLVHYSTPDEGPQVDSAEGIGRAIAMGTITLEDA